MEIIRLPKLMQDTCSTHRQRGRELGAVFTMGALHAGHMSLIDAARKENHIVVATVFVNPTQFSPGEDLSRYPRDPDADIKMLRAAGVDTLFMPEPQAMYPEGFKVSIDPGPIATKLCGAFRPGHFSGVATVVTKLLNITMPNRAYFGLKDAQQVVVIERLVRDLNMQTTIVSCPTLREPDGLAMSSRNRYLSPEERQAALCISKGLFAASEAISGGASPAEAARILRGHIDAEPRVSEVQYAGAYDPASLDPLPDNSAVCERVLFAVALKIGQTRLIDNMTALCKRKQS